MEVIFLQGSRKHISETNFEARKAIQKAMELVENKRGFRTCTETWWDCKLVITLGHNIYTTSIQIEPDAKWQRRWNNWHNGHAYYCNGVFWANRSGFKVELI